MKPATAAALLVLLLAAAGTVWWLAGQRARWRSHAAVRLEAPAAVTSGELVVGQVYRLEGVIEPEPATASSQARAGVRWSAALQTRFPGLSCAWATEHGPEHHLPGTAVDVFGVWAGAQPAPHFTDARIVPVSAK